MGIAANPALGAAIGQPSQSAFPAHPDRERGDLADLQRWRIPRPALGWAKSEIMLDAVALKDLRLAVVAMDRHRHGDGTLGIKDAGPVVLGNLEMVGDVDELFARHLKHGSGV